MKNFKFNGLSAKLFTWVFIQVFIFAAAMQARADDVYNFYFQKSPKETASAANAVSVSNASSAPAEHPKWEIGTSYSWMDGYSMTPAAAPVGGYGDGVHKAKGASVYFQHNFSRLVSMRLGYSYVKLGSKYKSWEPGNVRFGIDYGTYSYWNQERIEHLYSGALVFTPLRIDAKSHDFLTVGSVAGITRTLENKFKAYIEPEVSLFFTRGIGLRAQYRYVFDNEIQFNGSSYKPADTKMWSVGVVSRF